MPKTRPYPGVYIAEMSGDSRNIAGVPTSITAFLGRAPRGPVAEPTTCLSFADFAQRFGDLAVDYPLSYAVRQFFANGGREALIVRLFREAGDDGRARALVGDSLALMAAAPGVWGNGLRVTLGRHGTTGPEPEPVDAFDVQVEEAGSGALETFRNVSVDPAAGPGRIDRVLADRSALVRVDGALPTAVPAEATGVAATGGNDGQALDAATIIGDVGSKSGLHALEKADFFNLLCIPPDRRAGDTPEAVWQAAARYCVERRAFLLVDPPSVVATGSGAAVRDHLRATPPVSGADARNAAVFFPRLMVRDPLQRNPLIPLPPSAAIAGLYARSDTNRGVWRAPSGPNATLRGVEQLEMALDESDLQLLNEAGVNALRSLPRTGVVVWGARTFHGTENAADEYKYVPVRRLALFIEESLYRGTQWAVFEPNDEPLWAELRLTVAAFLDNLFRQGAFQGVDGGDAYFVRCDRQTTTQADIDHGVVNVVVGFAPLRPAEFVVLTIRQRLSAVDAPPPTRDDADEPHGALNVRVVMDGRYVAAVAALGTLKRTTEVVSDPLGAERTLARKMPGLSHYEPVTLERGLIHDAAFERWASRPPDVDAANAEADFRKDLTLEVCDEAGQVVSACRLLQCWPSACEVVAGSGGNAAAIETLTLEHEGWERV